MYTLFHLVGIQCGDSNTHHNMYWMIGYVKLIMVYTLCATGMGEVTQYDFQQKPQSNYVVHGIPLQGRTAWDPGTPKFT